MGRTWITALPGRTSDKRWTRGIPYLGPGEPKNHGNCYATGSWLITADHFERVLEAWLFGKFDPKSRHQGRLERMMGMEG